MTINETLTHSNSDYLPSRIKLPDRQMDDACTFIFLFIYFHKFIYFIYLFLAALGLHCCAWAFSSCDERGFLFIVVRGILVVVASLVAEHGL